MTSFSGGWDFNVPNGGSVTAKHIFLGEQRIATKKSNGTIQYIHSDFVDSSNVITDASGNKTVLLEYDPFGQIVTQTGTVNPRYKYTGQEDDGSTSLFDYNARLYDPQLGRFITADWIVQDPSDPQIFNRYGYVRNNPINYIDPTGNCTGDGTGDGTFCGEVFFESIVFEIWTQRSIPAISFGKFLNSARDDAGTFNRFADEFEEFIQNTFGGLSLNSAGQTTAVVGGALVLAGGGLLLTNPATAPVGVGFIGSASAAEAVAFTSGAVSGILLGIIGRTVVKNQSNRMMMEESKSDNQSRSTSREQTREEKKKSLRSLKKQLQIHEDKLNDYLNDPDAYDNEGLLKKAGNDTARRKSIINGRAKHLKKEINTFKRSINKLTNELESQ